MVDTHMTSTLRWEWREGVEAKMSCECSWRPTFTFFNKENSICAMTKHHSESNINMLLTRNLPTVADSEAVL